MAVYELTKDVPIFARSIEEMIDNRECQKSPAVNLDPEIIDSISHLA